ncbi:MAG: hypothetical protein RQ754_12170 [Desulfuromonadales bacterium]|nr:hypothetical protein [Desulfuromonadales bacterium]
MNGDLCRHVCFIFIVAACFLTACTGPTQRQIEIEQLLNVPEEKPYPAMDGFRFEGIPFGFVLNLSQRPFFAGEIPEFIDVAQTVWENVAIPEAGSSQQMRSILDCFCKGKATSISLNGGYTNSLHLQAGTESEGRAPATSDVDYFLELTLDLELISFKKETRITPEFLVEKGLSFEALVQRLVGFYGRPHYTHTRVNGSGKHKHLWWGVDDRALISANGYDYLNATHWNNFRGKTFHVAVWQNLSGEIVVEQTMKDNYRAFINEFADRDI